jgi:hypothetical protein
MKTPLLLPQPRSVVSTEGAFAVTDSGTINLNGSAQAMLFAGRQLQNELGAGWQIVAGDFSAETTIHLNLVSGSTSHPQGYELTVSADRIDIIAATPAAVFYGVQTLRQLFAQYDTAIPAMRVSDWPDFPNRGVMLDISRDKVPTMDTLYTLVDMFAAWKINQLQLYTEHTFAYQQHPVVWAEATPITGEQMLALDAYCRERFIELVPNQNTFGHMRRWLIHPEYNHLAECPDGCDTAWGHFDQPFTLYPDDPGSLELVRSLFDELLPHFSSTQVNVGLDETVDLGRGRSKAAVEELGAGRVYLDFVLKIYRDVQRRGKTMQLWGDILMNHPELVAELPRDVIALEWGYEAGHGFDTYGARYAQAGVPFYVCPGTSSWRTVAGRSDNALANMRSAAVNGLKHGAIGYLNTDWGDEGHWQPLSASFLPFAYGAAVAWAVTANVDADVIALANRFAFYDANEVMGALAHDLGNVYRTTGMQTFNSTVLFNALQSSPETLQNQLKLEDDTIQERIKATLTQIDAIVEGLDSAEMQRPDATLITQEYAWAADMLRHACGRILWVSNGMDANVARHLASDADRLIDRYNAIWHARNRSGGYRESVARMTVMRSTYGSWASSP